ncbi:MAG: hypothetical protein KAQ98_07275 [Bacteriovoracaceae bacterium]|nr:hypothetical protein [Bacteriovoracaceae bacterium]
MNKMLITRLFVLLIAACAFASVQASDVRSSRMIKYEGQDGETFELENFVKETRYRTEQQEGTCTRQIPYQDTVCGDETRYRQECHTVPGREECHIENERRCRTVTRYRESCRMVGGGQSCRWVGGGQRCRMINGRRVCTNEPRRRVCVNRPGRRVCERVPYTDTECDYYPRRVCNWIPAHQECRQVAYTEYVCREVTKYRTETYACMRDVQVPYEVTRNITADVECLFNNELADVFAEIAVNLTKDAKLKIRAKDTSERPVIILAKRKIEKDENGDDIHVRAKFRFDFVDLESTVSPVSREIEIEKFGRKKLHFNMGKILDQENLKIRVKIESSDKVWLNKELLEGDMNLEDVENGTRVKLDIKKLIGKKLGSMTSYKITVEAVVKLDGKVMNMDNLILNKKTIKKQYIMF